MLAKAGIRARIAMMEMGARQKMVNDRAIPVGGLLLINPQSTLLDADGSLWRLLHPTGLNGKYWAGSQPGHRFHDTVEFLPWTDAIDEIDERGERIVGATLVMLLNASVDAIPFVLPAVSAGERWVTLVDTADPWQPPARCAAGPLSAQSRSMACSGLRRQAPEWGPMGVYRKFESAWKSEMGVEAEV
jgi:hypothetical protein